MALTPEEVINKRFQATKFKEGYNPEEVDDFLDEVVIELRRLNAENTSLKRQLEDAENQLAEAQSAAANNQSSAVVPAAKPEPVEEAVVEPAPAPALVAEPAPAITANSAASLLAMAQKVHDDYVLEGKRERERLLTEGRESAAAMLNSAQEERARVLGDLEESRNGLENTVAELRTFEQNYRNGLLRYLQTQIKGLETESSVESQIQGAQTPAATPYNFNIGNGYTNQ